MDLIIFIEFLVAFFFTTISISKISKENFLKNYFINFTVTTTLWLLINFLFKYYNSFVGFKLAYAMGAFVSVSAIMITVSFSSQSKLPLKKVIKYNFIGFLFFLLSMSNIFFRLRENIHFENSFTSLFVFYAIFMISSLIFMTFKMIYCIKNFKGTLRIQAHYIFTGILSFGFFAFFMSSLAPILNMPHLAILDTFGALLFIICISYTIIAHNLMDIDLAWRKVASLGCYFLSFAIPFFSLSYLLYYLKINYFMAVMSIFVFVMFFWKIKYKLKKLFNHLFLGKYNIIWDKLKKVEIRSDMYDKGAVLNVLIFDAPKILEISYSAYYELDHSVNVYKLTPHKNTKKYYANRRKKIDISFESELTKELSKTKSFLYLETIKKENKNPKLVKELETLKIDICYPIFRDNEMKGLLVYGNKEQKKVFHTEDLEILRDIIKEAEKQINIIETVKYITENSLQNYRNTFQMQILEESKRIGSLRNIDDFSSYSVKVVDRFLNPSKTNIYLFDEDKEAYINKTDSSVEPIKVDNYLIRYLEERKDIVLLNSLERWAKETITKDFIEASETAKKIKASMIIPLMDLTHVLGFLTIDIRDEKRKYEREDHLLLSVICDKIQTTLANIYANEKANVDVLTGLKNRRFLIYRLQSKVIESYQTGKPLSLIMLDIDDFKYFNDAGGHDEGDIILRKVAETLKELVRPGDECFRYGGDEFSIIIPNTNELEAEQVAKRLQAQFKDHKYTKKLYEIFHEHITLSIGVTNYYPKEGKTKYTALEIKSICDLLEQKADHGLYESKKKGKDNVSVIEGFDEVKYEIDPTPANQEDCHED
jgi:diguanylate cyclase (GGDEF)-like protein